MSRGWSGLSAYPVQGSHISLYDRDNQKEAVMQTKKTFDRILGDRRIMPVAVLQFVKRSLVLTAVIMILSPLVQTLASSCRITFSSSSADYRVDDEVIVEMTLDGDVIPGMFEGYISYNADILEYVSGPECAAGGEGTLRISDMGYDSATLTRKYKFTFRAAGIGAATVAMRGNPQVYEADQGYLMSVSSNKLEINVSAATRASSDASLAIIRVNPGTLDPAFDPGIYEYFMQVPYDVTEVFVSAGTNDAGASVKIEGNTGLNIGQNRILLLVTAEDGTIGKYIIYVARAEAGATPEVTGTDTPTPEPASDEGNGQSVSDNIGNNGSGWAFSAESLDGEVFLNIEARYKVIRDAGNIAIPAGYSRTSVIISKNTITAYVPSDDPDSSYLLLILQKEGSEPALYSFDRVERTIQRFDSSAMAAANRTASGYSTIEEEELVKGYEKSLGTMTMVIAILSGVCMLLLIIVIRMALHRKNEL